MSELSPCPFCGEEPTLKIVDIQVEGISPYVHAQVWCEYCNIRKNAVIEIDVQKRPNDFVEALIKAESVAIKNWNRRGKMYECPD